MCVVVYMDVRVCVVCNSDWSDLKLQPSKAFGRVHERCCVLFHILTWASVCRGVLLRLVMLGHYLRALYS